MVAYMNSDTGIDRRSLVVAVALTALASAAPRIAVNAETSLSHQPELLRGEVQ
jgi:Ca2+/Na+ antiporter